MRSLYRRQLAMMVSIMLVSFTLLAAVERTHGMSPPFRKCLRGPTPPAARLSKMQGWMKRRAGLSRPAGLTYPVVPSSNL